MRTRCILQPTTTLTATSNIQETRFAKPVGHGKTGVAFINVYRNTMAATSTFNIETASQTAVDARAAGTSAFWITVATQATLAAATTGVVRMTLSNLGEVIRYRIDTAGGGNNLDLDIVVYFADT